MLRLRAIWPRSPSPSLSAEANAWAVEGRCGRRALPAWEIAHAAADAEAVREVALGAALAMSLDTSPAALLSMYEYARRNDTLRRRSA